ncbi:hypothetical protein A2671_00120 [Candidatus Kaiserbacteria bacterium RIFCSPHIGHO2_01_FULL_49_13]|uniref:DUF4440 domain-containing protein n=1 Tax=Candidatus Kaiserbacteria bacterium RIFCSPHIGHO2_01_FULL_49_13 TaxID=1798477 RepID=A0A1F6CDP8_9BACT|nr:MAG: hypothetical protein A2671_00120 [Candidatus Kaiserbacteria bacterium RIFCSPHIGHO2_01_FULL_49_13]
MELNVDMAQRLADTFAEAWNRGDMESACQSYAKNAIFISSSGTLVGRKNILNHYINSRNNGFNLGHLKFRVVEFQPTNPPTGKKFFIAAAVLDWSLTYDSMAKKGKSFVLYQLIEGQIFIVQSASFRFSNGSALS